MDMSNVFVLCDLTRVCSGVIGDKFRYFVIVGGVTDQDHNFS